MAKTESIICDWCGNSYLKRRVEKKGHAGTLPTTIQIGDKAQEDICRECICALEFLKEQRKEQYNQNNILKRSYALTHCRRCGKEGFVARTFLCCKCTDELYEKWRRNGAEGQGAVLGIA